MSVIRFFTDPHEGRELKANTTPASRALLRAQLHGHAMQAASMPHPAGKTVHFTVCAGDLFDTDHNSEEVLIAGAEVARQCGAVLGGNHDVVNILGRESSLSALAKLTGGDRFVLPPGPGKVGFEMRLVQSDAGHLGGVALYLVPHHAMQADFDQALDQALADAQRFDSTKLRRLLVVHCNYHLTFEAAETDLNLTDARARQLLKTFDYIVMGHDHRPRRECDGRVIILGNTHPTSFSDQGEKLVWFYDSETNDWVTAVNAPEALRSVSAENLIELHKTERLDTVLGSAEWLDVHGELPPEASVDLAKAMRACWKEIPYLYALRASKVRFTAGLDAGTEEQAPQQLTLIELIEQDLGKSPELLELFREVRMERE